MHKVVLTGYYGQSNLGDDIFCQVATWGVNRFWSEHAHFLVHDLPNFPDYLNYYKPPKYKMYGQALTYQYLMSMFSNVIVYSGGSIFHSRPDHFYSIQRLHLYLSYLGKKLGAIGISPGPFKSEKDYRWSKKFLSRFSFISSRDRYSYELLEEMNLPGNIVQAFDLGVLYPKIFGTSKSRIYKHSLKIIGVSLCHYERYVGKNIDIEKRREEGLLQALDLILGRRDDIILKFYVLNSNSGVGDREITDRFIGQLNRYQHRIKLIEYNKNTKMIYDDISGCDFMLGIRLHSGIMAYTASVPFILVEYHPKCTYFLDEIHFPGAYRVGSYNIDPYTLGELIDCILDQDKSIIYNDLIPLRRAQEKAIKSFTEAPWAISDINNEI